jgi:hypothetical protein
MVLTNEYEQNCVWKEKGSPSVVVGQVGEPPHVAYSDREADAGEDKLPLGTPLLPDIFVLYHLEKQRHIVE